MPRGEHQKRIAPIKVVIICALGLLLAIGIMIALTAGSKPPHHAPRTPPDGPVFAPIGTPTTTGTTMPQAAKQASSGVGDVVGTNKNVVGTTGVAGVTTSNNASPIATPGGVTYAAYVDPNYTRSPTNPLVVTYTYSAGGSVGNLALSSMPSGTIQFYADGGLVCTKLIGSEVDTGTCTVAFGGFGTQDVYATYNNGGAYQSATLADDIEPYATMVRAVISGGGSLGGLGFVADVTDQNGNSVTVGSVNLSIADVTQGWHYVVNGTIGAVPPDQTGFGCSLIENEPRIGEYGGCGLNGPITVSPTAGDTLTLTATYSGTSDWTGSQSTTVAYAMP